MLSYWAGQQPPTVLWRWSMDGMARAPRPCRHVFVKVLTLKLRLSRDVLSDGLASNSLLWSALSQPRSSGGSRNTAKTISDTAWA